MTYTVTVPESHRFQFDGKVALFGGGSVSQCLQRLLREHLGMDFTRLTIADMDPRVQDRIDPALLAGGARFERLEITPGNLAAELARLAGPGGLVINLTTGIATADIVGACHDLGALYIDTSVEVWERDTPPALGYASGVLPQTLYARHMALRERARAWAGKGATALVENGANPGLITYWLRQGLTDLTVTVLKDGLLGEDQARQAERALEDRDWAGLARALGVQVILDAERDTQAAAWARPPGTAANTWSDEGFVEEGLWGPVELGWGTDQVHLPEGALTHATGPRNQICLPRLGAETWAVAWTPTYGDIIGMVIRHGENFTISEAMTVCDGRTGLPVYRPTVFYVYAPCDLAVASLLECRMNGYRMPDRQMILTDAQIESGRDELGALILGAPTGWWCGASTSVGHASRMVPGQNPTTLQVAASITAAIGWVLDHPNMGLCTPEDIAARDHEAILRVAGPYLGDCPSVPTDPPGWTPLAHKDRHPLAALRPRPADPLQFGSFLVN